MKKKRGLTSSMNPPESDVVKVDLHPISEDDDIGFFACMTIDRPDKLNALNAEVMTSLKSVCAWMESSEDVRVLVVTGAAPKAPPEGKRAKPHAFVAGADITEFAGAGSGVIREKFRDNAVEALWNLSKPTIAMVDGFALGGGSKWRVPAMSESRVTGPPLEPLKSILDSSRDTGQRNGWNAWSVTGKRTR